MRGWECDGIKYHRNGSIFFNHPLPPPCMDEAKMLKRLLPVWCPFQCSPVARIVAPVFQGLNLSDQMLLLWWVDSECKLKEQNRTHETIHRCWNVAISNLTFIVFSLLCHLMISSKLLLAKETLPLGKGFPVGTRTIWYAAVYPCFSTGIHKFYCYHYGSRRGLRRTKQGLWPFWFRHSWP